MVLGVIPARLNSTRFPKKILTPILGKPMIAHVVERALESKNLDKVILAIDDNETEEALKGYNFDIMMTNNKHFSGTDRIAEVAKKLNEAKIVINIQGDEPLVDPTIIDDLVDVFENKNVEMATVISKKLSVEDLIDLNIVKAVIDEKCNAIDFRREVLDIEIGGLYRHIGMYGFRRDTLFRFMSFPRSELEKKYNLEQMRAIQNGIMIKAIITDMFCFSVDTEDDLKKIKKIIN